MKFNFTPSHLKLIIGNNAYLDNWYEAINNICPNYGIDTPQRLAAFIAQCAHESANFTALKENLNYRAESLMKTWPKRFPSLAIAQQYAKNPEKIANKVYADRMGNGPEASGDGWKYLGRGLIQLTGKENYTKFATSVCKTLEETVVHLGTIEGAVQSACWFWETNNLNQWVDKGDIKTLTQRINGGDIGLADRIKHYQHACQILGA